ncbi:MULTISPECIES: molecular chaperone HtpG [unclassified Ectothiorhodospira]|uniref:molecular chaperone HtpG n=1 Tax=unclassified Ectothiorhodospira TaxID=2684909 RepID=UPI001EE8DB01|nr:MULTISPECIES: molecular chaperone HtpG [unclassified Ectothiorhodospira]MCG5516326.1 molecular chaperone HtpG [Ectothiorhodospira sp. 9100]MCG5519295.1 molecular chaperone HtpG [Ectothiorhodospira sp. 9905]
MSVDTHKETRQFQTEVSQLLHLMINALYSNKEIFLRELVSNAADACDKLRFEALADDALMEGEGDLSIQVEYDKDARTVTVRDNGIGMSRDDVINNIGTIAHSGTREFLSRLTGDQKKDAHLIGQFGVGFYSSFIVADRVTLTTRRAGMGAEHGVRWESDGSGEFTVETVERPERGTEVVLHLKQDEDEFLDEFRLRHIITRYSDHIPLPITMRKRDDDGKALEEWETVNRASALWTRSKSEISDEEYKAFYKHVAHDFEEPLTWTHNRVEGRQEYTSLLYIPKRAPFDLWDRDRRHGIKLYVQRVFIMDDAEQLMPTYLRFVRGVVDSNDLPLNISREILQNNRLIDGIRSGSVKKVLGLLEDLAKKDPEEYQTFWDAFGRVLKEGPAEDYANREQIGRLLRFASTHTGESAQNVSLSDYIGRMKEGQDTIYYITADSHTAALHSPHLEVFRKRGIEVLLLSDRVDEWLVSHLHEFEGKSLKSVAKGDLDLGDTETEEEKKAQQEAEEQVKDLLPRIQEALGERVKEVRFSHRLTDSPACIVLSEDEMALYMQQLLKQAGQNLPDTKPVLEVNPGHRLIQRMGEETDEARFKDWSSLLLDQAVLAEGGQLEDPAGFVKRLNTLITHG